MAEKRLVGKSIPRVDAPEKIRGFAKYIDDYPLQDGLYGAIVRSPVAHGIFKGYALDENWEWAGYTIVSADDITGENAMTSVVSDHPFLAVTGGVINYIGEACLLIAHHSKDMLREGLRRIKLDIEELKPLPDIETQVETDESQRPKPFDTFNIDKGDPKNIFNSNDPGITIVEGIYTTGHQEQMYLEVQGMESWWEGDKVCVAGSLQCPYYVHGALRSLFGLPADKVRVIQTDTGGAFGGKEEFPSLLAGHVALLSKKSGKRVRIIFDREEDLLYTTKRHPTVSKIRTAVRNDGEIIAVETETFMDTGAYITLSPVVLARCVLHMTAPYEIPHSKIIGHLCKTNTPPNGAYRGFGAPQAFFAMEMHMEDIAKRLKIDPVKLRSINHHRKGSLTMTSQNMGDDVWCAEVLEKAVDLSEYYKKKSEIEAFNKLNSRKKRGIGLSLVYHGAAFTGGGENKMGSVVRLEFDDNGVAHIRASNMDMGQGSKTVLRQIGADTLGVDIDMVRYDNPDTDVVPDSGPTVASRTTMIVGGMIKKACEVALKDSDNKGKVYEVGYEQPPGLKWDEDKFKGDAYPGFSYMASVVELEVDLTTLLPKFLSITAIVEAGQVINPELARGQIAGGIAQSIGWALMENPVYKENLMRNPSLSKLLIPSIEDIPELKIEFLNVSESVKDYAPKGIGELPMNSPSCASAIALSNALDIDIKKIPITASAIYKAISEKG